MPTINTDTKSQQKKLQQKTLAMLLAVPQVMTNRLWMIVTTNPICQHSTQQQHDEIHTMIAEKQLAFMQSITDIGSQLFSSQMTLSLAMLSDWQGLLMGNQNTYAKINQKIEIETLKILDKGISPYAQAVKNNQHRLVK